MASLNERLKAAQERRQLSQPPDQPPSPRPMAGASLNERLREAQRLREQGVQMRGPVQQDVLQREMTLGKQVGQTGLGEPGMEDIAARADIQLSRTFEEQRAKFMAKYPEGDFVQASEDPTRPGAKSTILFRRNQQEEFREFDAPALQKFELLGDVADISAELPAAAFELAFTRGRRLVTQMLQIAAGNITGEMAKEAVETARGFQRETFPEILERSIKQSAIAAGGAAATTLATGPLNAFRGAAMVPVAPGAQRAIQASRELGIPPLTAAQVAINPLIRRLGGQSAATVGTIKEYIRNQQAASVQAILRLRAPELEQFLEGNLRQLHNDAADQITTAANIVQRNLTEGGTALQEGIAEFDNLSNTLVNRAYSDARAIAEPTFDVNALRSVAAEILVRAETLGPEGNALRNLAQQVIDAGNFAPRSVTTATGDILEMSSTDQMRWLQQQAGDLSQPPRGEIRKAPEKMAARLFGMFSRTLDNPNAASPEFREAWGEARSLARKRFETLEKLAVVQAARTETPAILAERLAKPNQVDNIGALREAVPDAQFRQFQEATKANFVAPQNIGSLTRRLESFDRETLDALFDTTAQNELRQAGLAYDRLQAVGIREALERQSQFAARVDDLVNRQDTAAISELLQRAPEGSPARNSIRAGMMENIVTRVTRTVEGEPVVDSAALRGELERLSQTGALRLLTQQDRQILGRLDEVVEFLPSRPDSGTSLQAASAAAGFRELSFEAMSTILENIGVGRLLTNPTFNRIALGTGAEKRAFRGVRVLGSFLAKAATDVERENKQIDRSIRQNP